MRSENEYFDALLCDFEVMKYEADITGWKIALTTTEFLCSGSLDTLEDDAIRNENLGFRIPVAEMIDSRPDSALSYNESLVKQKVFGRASSWVRLYHRFKIGAYAPGRHNFYLPSCSDVSCEAIILKYALSPWCDRFLERKLQIGARIPSHDVRAGFGVQHLWSKDIIISEYRKGLAEARDLSQKIILASTNHVISDPLEGEFLLVTQNKTILFLDRHLNCLRHSDFLSAQLNLFLHTSAAGFRLHVRNFTGTREQEDLIKIEHPQIDDIIVERISNNRVILHSNSQLIYSTPGNTQDFSGPIPYEFAQYTLVPISSALLNNY